MRKVIAALDSSGQRLKYRNFFRRFFLKQETRSVGCTAAGLGMVVWYPELVTRGIYTRIRHPMYTAHFLWGISQTLLLWNFLAGFGFLVGFLVFFPLRLRLEEANLKRTFGEAYDEYAAKTPRFIPWRNRP